MFNKKEYFKEYYLKHKNKLISRSKHYYKINKKRIDIARKTYRDNHREQLRSYQREYHKQHRQNMNAKTKQWRETNPEKINAHRVVRHLKIPKNTLCEHCKKNLAMNKHHPDYTKPKEVQFLCTACHRNSHIK